MFEGLSGTIHYYNGTAGGVGTPLSPGPQVLSITAADRTAAATRDRRGVAEVLPPEAAAGLPPDVAPVLSPGDAIPERMLPSRPFAR